MFMFVLMISSGIISSILFCYTISMATIALIKKIKYGSNFIETFLKLINEDN